MRELIYHDVAQGSADWLALHIGVPSASNFDRIITAKTGKPSSSMLDLSYELLSIRTVQDMLGGRVSAAMSLGIEREPEARSYYELYVGNKVRQVGFVQTADQRFGCSPDGLVGDDGGLELKCPTPKTHVRYLLEGGLPPEYKAQVHGFLVITGRSWCDFMSYCRGEPPMIVRVRPDEYTKQLEACMEEFWKVYSTLREALNALRNA